MQQNTSSCNNSTGSISSSSSDTTTTATTMTTSAFRSTCLTLTTTSDFHSSARWQGILIDRRSINRGSIHHHATTFQQHWQSVSIAPAMTAVNWSGATATGIETSNSQLQQQRCRPAALIESVKLYVPSLFIYLKQKKSKTLLFPTEKGVWFHQVVPLRERIQSPFTTPLQITREYVRCTV